MRKIGWISTMAAVAALSACNAQDTAAPEPQPTETEPTGAQASAPAAAVEPTGAADAAPTPPDAEYANSRPPLDNSGAEATPGSCLAELGRKEAETLSEQCYAMSPATRPPCNIQNSCERIREELKRGCEFGDTSENPDYCSEV